MVVSFGTFVFIHFCFCPFLSIRNKALYLKQTGHKSPVILFPFLKATLYTVVHSDPT